MDAGREGATLLDVRPHRDGGKRRFDPRLSRFRAEALFGLPPGTLSWDVSTDGQRFLINAPVTKSSAIPLSLVLNWTAGLKR